MTPCVALTLSQVVGLPVNSLPFGPHQVSAANGGKANQYSNRKGASSTASNEYDGRVQECRRPGLKERD
jgi:hypothetical protein